MKIRFQTIKVANGLRVVVLLPLTGMIKVMQCVEVNMNVGVVFTAIFAPGRKFIRLYQFFRRFFNYIFSTLFAWLSLNVAPHLVCLFSSVLS